MAYRFRPEQGGVLTFQLTFGIPLDSFDFDIVPLPLREAASSIRFLRFGTEGFVAVCRVPPERQRALLRGLERYYRLPPARGVTASAEGKTMIRIQGTVFRPGSLQVARIRATFRRLRRLEQSRQLYFRPPVLGDDTVRYTVIAEPPALRWLQRTLGSLHIPYRVHQIRPLEREAVTPLETLTNPQRRAFLLAHARGYYDVPRRVDTGGIARELSVNRGTVGRLLRRAERHIVEWAVAQPSH